MAYTYKKTPYDKDVDYSVLINQMIGQGAPAGEVSTALNSRITKANEDPNLNKYAMDTTTQKALEYLNTSAPTAPRTSTMQHPAYSSPYGGAIDALLQQISNTGQFQYNHEDDPLYAQYKDTYTREGQRAMQDVVGEVSARTGGLASSYAATAGAQAQNEYMKRLSDTIPQLQQLAYSMYRDNKSDQYNQLGLLSGLESDAYGKYRDTVSDYRYADDQAWRDKEWQNQLSQQNLSNQRYQDETAYGRGQTEREWDYQLGRDATSDERYEREYSNKIAQQARSGQSYGGSGKAAEESEGYTTKQWLNYQDVYSRLMKDKTPQEAISYINRVGEETYTDLMGEELFQQMLQDVMGTKPQEPQEPEKQGTFGAIYTAMSSSGDPESWLTQNAQYLTNEELKYVISILDSLGGGGYGNLG